MKHGTDENLGYLLTRAAHAWSLALEHALAEEGHPGMTAAHGAVLVPLFDQDRLSQAEVLARSGLTKGTLSLYVKQLVKAGLIEATPDPADRRVRNLRLTAKGRALKRASDKAVARVNRQFVAGMPERRRAATMRTLVDWAGSAPEAKSRP